MVQQRDFGSQDSPTLYVADLTVYRAFEWGTLGPYLHGIFKPERWREHQTAVCYTWPRSEDHLPDAPDPKCTCGIYAWYSPERDWAQNSYQNVHVFGALRVSGRVVAGSLGVRVERATLLAVAPLTSGLELMQWRATGENAYVSFVNGMSYAYPSAPVFSRKSDLVNEFPPSDWESIVGPIGKPEPDEWVTFGASRSIRLAGSLGARIPTAPSTSGGSWSSPVWSATAAMNSVAAQTDSLKASMKKMHAASDALKESLKTPVPEAPIDKILERKRNANRGPAVPQFKNRGKK